MDFYTLLGLGADASAAEIKRAYRRLSRRYHPDINPGDRTAETLSGASLRRTKPCRSGSAPLVRLAAARPAAAGDATFEFTGFDFSAARAGPQAATFSELFAEVLHPVSARGRGTAAAGRRYPRDAAVSVRRVDARRRAAGDRRRGRSPCSACGGAGAVRHAGGRGARRARAAAECAGRAATWCSRRVARPASGTGRSGSCSAARRARATGGRCAAKRCAVAMPPGVHDGARLRVAERGHAGRRGGANGRSLRHRSGRAAPRVPPRGRRPLLHHPGGVHEAVLGARIEVPSLDGIGQAADAARHAGGPALPAARSAACRRRPAARGDLSSRCGSCCRRSSTSAARS